MTRLQLPWATVPGEDGDWGSDLDGSPLQRGQAVDFPEKQPVEGIEEYRMCMGCVWDLYRMCKG